MHGWVPFRHFCASCNDALQVNTIAPVRPDAERVDEAQDTRLRVVEKLRRRLDKEQDREVHHIVREREVVVSLESPNGPPQAMSSGGRGLVGERVWWLHDLRSHRTVVTSDGVAGAKTLLALEVAEAHMDGRRPRLLARTGVVRALVPAGRTRLLIATDDGQLAELWATEVLMLNPSPGLHG